MNGPEELADNVFIELWDSLCSFGEALDDEAFIALAVSIRDRFDDEIEDLIREADHRPEPDDE